MKREPSGGRPPFSDRYVLAAFRRYRFRLGFKGYAAVNRIFHVHLEPPGLLTGVLARRPVCAFNHSIHMIQNQLRMSRMVRTEFRYAIIAISSELNPAQASAWGMTGVGMF